jgi:hypothetical protein
MYFTLAVSAATRQACAALAEAAERADPRVMPIPGPARVAWRAPAERLLGPQQADRHGAWALATLDALLSGDWLSAREPASQALLR